MPLALHIYRDPTSFLQAIETISVSDRQIDIDVVMSTVIGGTSDFRKTTKTGLWMMVTREDFKLGSTLNSETYILPLDAVTISRDVDTQQYSILLVIYSINLHIYCTATQIPLLVGANESVERFFSTLMSSIVDITVGKHLQRICSVFGPKILVHSLLDAWRVASERALRVIQIATKPMDAVNLAWISKERSLELLEGRVSSNSGEYTIVDISTIDQSPDGSTAWDMYKSQSVKNQLVRCMIEFQYQTTGRLKSGHWKYVEVQLREAQEKGSTLWVCIKKSKPTMAAHDLSEPIVAGYVKVGYETKRTISIAQVFVKAKHRGRGIATHMVRTTCIRYLTGPRGQPRVDSDSTSAATRVVGYGAAIEADEADNGKDIVTLYVEPENTAAVRAYSRVGFTIEGIPWERRGFEGGSPCSS